MTNSKLRESVVSPSVASGLGVLGVDLPGRLVGAQANTFLKGLGERVSQLRARKGLTRRALSESAGVSERHIANLEYGKGNASILVLLQIANALDCALSELIVEQGFNSAEWLLIRSLIAHQDEMTLKKVRLAVGEVLGASADHARGMRPLIALIGLRGAGKSTLGKMLAQSLDQPFIELSREIEQSAGCSASEIQGLFGVSAYRRYERRALESVIKTYSKGVIATTGGLVSDPGTFNVLLAHCSVIWLQATPEEHMQRVRQQGDLRPMQGNKEAMEDLKNILQSRSAFYSKAHLSLDTSGQDLSSTFELLKSLIHDGLAV